MARSEGANGYALRPGDPADSAAVEILREYYGEVLRRHQGRDATDAEITAALAADPSDGLVGPQGVFLLAQPSDTAGPPHGCAGLRFLDHRVGEVKRVYVRPVARGRQLATALMDDIEARARAGGLIAVRLESRSELSQARAMYVQRGYRDVAPFTGSALADVWMQKDL